MLTATQKLHLEQLHGQYMAAECSVKPYNAKDAGEKASKFFKYVDRLNLTIIEAEKIAWEVKLDFEEIALKAINEEGYKSKYFTPEIIEYFKLQVAKKCL